VKEPGLIAKTLAAIGAIWLAWVLISLLFGVPGPLGMNQ
jgi:hypothetical protein